jgi:hypothetical protein
MVYWDRAEGRERDHSGALGQLLTLIGFHDAEAGQVEEAAP